MPRPPWKSPTQEKPRAAGLDWHRVDRAVDLLRRGATEGKGPAGMIALIIDGRAESSFQPATLKAAKARLAEEVLFHG
jgi:hypothetical protein